MKAWCRMSENTTIKSELRKYIEMMGRIQKSPFSGVTLVTPSIEELCDMYSTTSEIIAEVLVDMNIMSGISHAKRSNR